MDEYEKFEIECDRVRAENEKLLEEFSSWLKETIKEEMPEWLMYMQESDDMMYSDSW